MNSWCTLQHELEEGTALTWGAHELLKYPSAWTRGSTALTWGAHELLKYPLAWTRGGHCTNLRCSWTPGVPSSMNSRRELFPLMLKISPFLNIKHCESTCQHSFWIFFIKKQAEQSLFKPWNHIFLKKKYNLLNSSIAALLILVKSKEVSFNRNSALKIF